MQNSLWTITSLRRAALAAGFVIALSATAQAQDTPSFAAPLDTGWSTYADFIEYPDFLPGAPRPPAFAGGETTGTGDAAATSGGNEMTGADENDPYPDNIWKFAP